MSEPEQKAEQRAAAAALKEVLSPVRAALTVGRILAAVSGLLAVVPYVALVKLGAVLIDAEISNAPVDSAEVGFWIRVLLIAFSARLLIYFAALYITHSADVTVGHLIRERMVRRFARVPLSWFTSTNSGRVRKALQDDIGQVHHLIAHQPVEGTSAIVMPLGLLGYAFWVDWRLGLLTIATLPMYLLAMSMSLRGMGEKTAEMDERLSTVSARMVEFVTGITVVKAFGRVGSAHRSYKHAADEFSEFYRGWVIPLVRVSVIGNSLLAVPLILLVNLGGGTALVHGGYVTAADVLATSLIALLVPFAIETVMNGAWAQQIAGAAAKRITDLLATTTLSENTAETAVPQGNDVVFDHVSYSYPSADAGRLAVDDVSFTLRSGTVTALVGPSGSGKSTIATLLARFDDPRTGTITIGGAPIDRIENLYSRVGFVLQDPQLLAISIRDNIALGRPDATDEQIRAAASAARVLEEIDRLPDGFDTVYGSGTELSGGQAQRVAIARALLVDAPVLILDEATALADPEAQHEIQQALSELARGKTVLLIGHRAEVISGVDQIVLIDSGRVVATGTHETMLSQPGYARIWHRAQATAGESR